jgi:aminoglycoside phosphotransferase (APT) family kinase protein
MVRIADDATLAQQVVAYLSAQDGHAVTVGALRRFPVGFSWLTYLVPVRGLGGWPEEQELILRLGPDDGLFAPYSALPQVLALQSLHGSAVPVPRPYWSGDDNSVFGAPFLFSAKAEGEAVVPWVAPGEPPLEESYRSRLAAQFVDALAALHCVRWQDQPIAAMADGITERDAAARAIAYWEERSGRWALRPDPLADWGLRWLKAHAPNAPRVAIVHGDYRTGNFLEVGGRITAILDWELVHLGDPHEDLAWASLPMYMGGTRLVGRLAEPDMFYARYAERAGFAVTMKSLRSDQALSLLKLAAPHMAAARCFEAGRFNDLRMPAMGSQIATCLRQMEKSIMAWDKEPA